MYLANDVIQNGKKKGTEFGAEFEGTLKRAFEHLSTSSGGDDKTKQGILKILKIWEDRGVYEHKVIKEWKTFFGPSPAPKSNFFIPNVWLLLTVRIFSCSIRKRSVVCKEASHREFEQQFKRQGASSFGNVRRS